ncbi:MAG: hypothetical protein J6C28_00905 [Bacilli bacterium]|nr:hypothetical protein [Bacilli bacterium]
MEMLNVILPVLLYVAGIVALIVLTVLGIRLIQILNKVDRVVDNVEEKVNSLNTAFDVIGKASDTLALVGDSVVNGIASVVTRFFNKRFNKEEDNYE